jgi:hypothetical protein
MRLFLRRYFKDMKKIVIIVLVALSSCITVEKGETTGCVVYEGYNQRWFRKVTILNDGRLRATKFTGENVVLVKYDRYECKNLNNPISYR